MNRSPVLYAEDDENDAFLTTYAFQKAEVLNPLVVVNDGHAAIQYMAGCCKSSPGRPQPFPCLILLDIKMPRQSGFDVLQWVRKEPAVCAVPVIMLTSSNHDADVARAYSLGANGYLIKPNKPDEMLAMVKAIKEFWLLLNREGSASDEG